MIINKAGRALTQLGPQKVDMLILHNCLSAAVMSWTEMENLTSGKFCSVSIIAIHCGLLRGADKYHSLKGAQ